MRHWDFAQWLAVAFVAPVVIGAWLCLLFVIVTLTQWAFP